MLERLLQNNVTKTVERVTDAGLKGHGVAGELGNVEKGFLVEKRKEKQTDFSVSNLEEALPLVSWHMELILVRTLL